MESNVIRLLKESIIEMAKSAENLIRLAEEDDIPSGDRISACYDGWSALNTLIDMTKEEIKKLED